jgi:hypothetical protein
MEGQDHSWSANNEQYHILNTSRTGVHCILLGRAVDVNIKNVIYLEGKRREPTTNKRPGHCPPPIHQHSLHSTKQATVIAILYTCIMCDLMHPHIKQFGWVSLLYDSEQRRWLCSGWPPWQTSGIIFNRKIIQLREDLIQQATP